MVQRLFTIVLAGWLLLGAIGTAEANGSPLRVILTYLPDVSNWGPPGATGIAELVMVEGEVRLTALGLPQLSGEVYDVWLVNAKTNEFLELAELNADSRGEARLVKVLPQAIPDRQWDLLLLTVEKTGGPRTAPSERRTIAGLVKDHRDLSTVPQELPYTGGTAAGLAFWPLAIAATVGGVAGAAGYHLFHIRRTKETPN